MKLILHLRRTFSDFVVILFGKLYGCYFKVDYALKRLSNMHITLELLSETGVGKAVNQLRDHPEYGKEAREIVERWKDLARSHGLSQRKLVMFSFC